MVSRAEREVLEDMRGRLRTGKFALLGFFGLSLIAGIPVGNRPLFMLPEALGPLLFLAGILWSLSIYSFTRSLARSCPRCGSGTDDHPRSMWSALTHRTFWGSRCMSCGLSFKDLDATA